MTKQPNAVVSFLSYSRTFRMLFGFGHSLKSLGEFAYPARRAA